MLYLVHPSSYGSVFKAKYRKKNCTVAVKIIPSESRDEGIMREIHILKECKSDYIIRYYGSYYKDDNLWVLPHVVLFILDYYGIWRLWISC